jgi:hypothetical protein
MEGRNPNAKFLICTFVCSCKLRLSVSMWPWLHWGGKTKKNGLGNEKLLRVTYTMYLKPNIFLQPTCDNRLKLKKILFFLNKHFWKTFSHKTIGRRQSFFIILNLNSCLFKSQKFQIRQIQYLIFKYLSDYSLC